MPGTYLLTYRFSGIYKTIDEIQNSYKKYYESVRDIKICRFIDM